MFGACAVGAARGQVGSLGGFGQGPLWVLVRVPCCARIRVFGSSGVCHHGGMSDAKDPMDDMMGFGAEMMLRMLPT